MQPCRGSGAGGLGQRPAGLPEASSVLENLRGLSPIHLLNQYLGSSQVLFQVLTAQQGKTNRPDSPQAAQVLTKSQTTSKIHERSGLCSLGNGLSAAARDSGPQGVNTTAIYFARSRPEKAVTQFRAARAQGGEHRPSSVRQGAQQGQLRLALFSPGQKSQRDPGASGLPTAAASFITREEEMGPANREGWAFSAEDIPTRETKFPFLGPCCGIKETDVHIPTA